MALSVYKVMFLPKLLFCTKATIINLEFLCPVLIYQAVHGTS